MKRIISFYLLFIIFPFTTLGSSEDNLYPNSEKIRCMTPLIVKTRFEDTPVDISTGTFGEAKIKNFLDIYKNHSLHKNKIEIGKRSGTSEGVDLFLVDKDKKLIILFEVKSRKEKAKKSIKDSVLQKNGENEKQVQSYIKNEGKTLLKKQKGPDQLSRRWCEEWYSQVSSNLEISPLKEALEKGFNFFRVLAYMLKEPTNNHRTVTYYSIVKDDLRKDASLENAGVSNFTAEREWSEEKSSDYLYGIKEIWETLGLTTIKWLNSQPVSPASAQPSIPSSSNPSTDEKKKLSNKIYLKTKKKEDTVVSPASVSLSTPSSSAPDHEAQTPDDSKSKETLSKKGIEKKAVKQQEVVKASNGTASSSSSPLDSQKEKIDDEFRQRVILESEESGVTLTFLAQKYGYNPSTISSWKTKFGTQENVDAFLCYSYKTHELNALIEKLKEEFERHPGQEYLAEISEQYLQNNGLGRLKDEVMFFNSCKLSGHKKMKTTLLEKLKERLRNQEKRQGNAKRRKIEPKQ